MYMLNYNNKCLEWVELCYQENHPGDGDQESIFTLQKDQSCSKADGKTRWCTDHQDLTKDQFLFAMHYGIDRVH